MRASPLASYTSNHNLFFADTDIDLDTIRRKDRYTPRRHEMGGYMRRRLKRSSYWLAGGIALFAAFLGLQLYFGNFHEVVRGEVYRSAQLHAGDIAHYKAEHQIKSVLNLRGEHTGDSWYDTEVAEAKTNGVEHINFRMSATTELTDAEAFQLIQIMRDAPKPMLIHCRSGADRTGLASALYIAAVSKGGEEAAERQLWITYGHLPFYFNAAFAMNRTFERLEPALGFPDS